MTTLLTPAINTESVANSANFYPQNLKITVNFVCTYKNHRKLKPFDFQWVKIFLQVGTKIAHMIMYYRNMDLHFWIDSGKEKVNALTEVNRNNKQKMEV